MPKLTINKVDANDDIPLQNAVFGITEGEYVNIRDFYEYAYCYKEDEQYSYYLFYKRTSELNSLEFSKLLNGTVEECKQQGIETLDDKEINKLLEEMDK